MYNLPGFIPHTCYLKTYTNKYLNSVQTAKTNYIVRRNRNVCGYDHACILTCSILYSLYGSIAAFIAGYVYKEYYHNIFPRNLNVKTTITRNIRLLILPLMNRVLPSVPIILNRSLILAYVPFETLSEDLRCCFHHTLRIYWALYTHTPVEVTVIH